MKISLEKCVFKITKVVIVAGGAVLATTSVAAAVSSEAELDRGRIMDGVGATTTRQMSSSSPVFASTSSTDSASSSTLATTTKITSPGKAVRTREAVTNRGESVEMSIQQRVRERLEAPEFIAEFARERMDAMHAESIKLSRETDRVALENHVPMIVALESIVAGQAMLGAQAGEIVAITEELDQSVTRTMQQEININSRGRFVRFFAGGNDDAAEAVFEEVRANQGRLSTISQTIGSCTSCTPASKEALQTQVEIMQREQLRLKTMAQAELNDKGLFGILFGWIK